MNVFWPDVEDRESAHKACGVAAGMAFFIAGVTGLVAWLQSTGKINILPGVGLSAFIDVGLFVLIGIGLCFHSRIAAIAGLLLYIAERIFMMKTHGVGGGQIAMVVVLLLAFVNGVRGAFAWHEFKNLETGEETAVASREITAPVAEKPKKAWRKTLLMISLSLLLLVGAIFAAAYFFTHHGSGLRDQVRHLRPAGPPVKLTLKSGRVFEGTLIRKNEQGYWLDINGTGEVFFSTGEIAEAA